VAGGAPDLRARVAIIDSRPDPALKGHAQRDAKLAPAIPAPAKAQPISAQVGGSSNGRLAAQYSLKWPNSAILCIFSYNAKQFDFPKTSGERVKNVVRVGFEISIVPGITNPPSGPNCG